MNNDEAKFILGAYSPYHDAAKDPAMAEALDQAKRDPALGAWFARQHSYDTAMSAKLREVAPPAGLRAAILAGGQFSTGAESDRKRKVRAWWRQPAWLAMAACLALVAGLTTWRFMPVPGQSMEEFAVNFVQKGFRLQKHSGDVAALKTWLGEQHGPLPETLPAKFAELQALGCRTLDYRGHEVSLVCFERGGKEFHVFVARREDATGMARDGQPPQFYSSAKLASATWMDAKNRYVLVSDAGLEAIKSLL